jgi:hypothetical protein
MLAIRLWDGEVIYSFNFDQANFCTSKSFVTPAKAGVQLIKNAGFRPSPE